jgi:YD repeat-containing protein
MNKIPQRAIDSLRNIYSSSPDGQGIFTVLEYKRANGTLYMRSTLKNPLNGWYREVDWEFFDLAGTTLLYKQIWTLTYDALGNITSKVVSQS